MATTDTIAASLSGGLNVTHQTTGNDGATITDVNKIGFNGTFIYGTGLDSCNLNWHDQRSVNPVADDDLDLTVLPLSVFGQIIDINFVNVRAIVIACLSTTSGDKLYIDTTVANAYLGPWSSSGSKPVIGANSVLIVSNKKDGFGATSSTNKVIRVHNPGAAAVSYQVAIIGNNA